MMGNKRVITYLVFTVAATVLLLLEQGFCVFTCI